MHVDLKKEIKESGPGKTGIIILLIMIAVASLAPFIAPYNPYQHSTACLTLPSWSHWLGNNHVGQDILSRLVFGARTSLLVGFGVGIFATLLSIVFGVSAALVGGLYDKIVMRTVDAFIVIPMLIIVILVATYIKPSILILIVLLSLLTWQGGARTIRAQALSLKQRGHVLAARTFGANHSYITWHHIVPDLGPVLLTNFIYTVRKAVFMEAGLAFLGITDPTVVSWGMMMRDALSFSYLNVWQWWLIPVGIALSLTIVGLTFTGYALEPVIEPRLRGVEIA